MKEIKITVLMAAYNESRYISDSIRSILRQSYTDFEFIIIDDGSNDDTEKTIKSFDDARIRYRKISHRGLAGALNFGLSISEGDWIARIDADDINTPDRLEKQIKYINKEPRPDVVGSWSVYFKDPGKILFLLKPPTNNHDIKHFLNLHNPINHSSVIFNKKQITEAGGYNEIYSGYEDFELWLRLKNKAEFLIISDFLVYTRLRKDSLTQMESKNNICKFLMENAKRKFQNANNSGEKKYWKNILFWIEYFYGNKSKARRYFTGNISMKRTMALVNTFLPEYAFRKILELRLKYRIKYKFEGGRKFKHELQGLLKA